MAQPIHEAATHHVPGFVSAPGETDVLFVVTAVLVLVIVLLIGTLYFKLHALPEHMAHRGQKVQFEFVAVLGLISLFTHNHAFWIAGLLLALIPLPDFTTPIQSIATSLDRIAGGTGSTPPQPAPAQRAHAQKAPIPPAPAAERPTAPKEA